VSAIKMTVIELCCDYPGCDHSQSTAGGFTRISDEREHAKQQGWTSTKGGFDFCPDHSVVCAGR
jgi:hypothetical protein